MNISPQGYRYLVPALLPLAGLYLFKKAALVSQTLGRALCVV